MKLHRIAIFASGNGTNAENIVRYFKNHEQIEISLVLTNNPGAGVIHRMKILNLPCMVFDRNDLYENGRVSMILKNYGITFIVLAGFLWKIPQQILNDYPDRIVNIHPALLPKYGGKGMYGMKVHQAVAEAKERESGITIHYVNDNYDEGKIIFQARCKLNPAEDSPETIAEKVHFLEYRYYPEVIEKLLTEK